MRSRFKPSGKNFKGYELSRIVWPDCRRKCRITSAVFDTSIVVECLIFVFHELACDRVLEGAETFADAFQTELFKDFEVLTKPTGCARVYRRSASGLDHLFTLLYNRFLLVNIYIYLFDQLKTINAYFYVKMTFRTVVHFHHQRNFCIQSKYSDRRRKTSGFRLAPSIRMRMPTKRAPFRVTIRRGAPRCWLQLMRIELVELPAGWSIRSE